MNSEITDIHYTDTIHYELEQTARLMRMLAHQLFDKLSFNLSLDECIALDIVATNDNICQRDLAKKILKDRANTGRILNSLEKKGYIKRLLDLKNNRPVKKIQLSKTGKQVLIDTAAKIKSHIENVTTTISPDEIHRIRDILRVFMLNFEQVVEMNI